MDQEIRKEIEEAEFRNGESYDDVPLIRWIKSHIRRALRDRDRGDDMIDWIRQNEVLIECQIADHDRRQLQAKEKEVEGLNKRYNALGVKFDKELERWQERDADELDKRKTLESQLQQSKADNERLREAAYSNKEFEMAYIFGLFGREELGFWDGRFAETLKKWEKVKEEIFKITRPITEPSPEALQQKKV